MKIDVTKIEGFEGMTDAEKITAMQNFEIEEKKPTFDEDKYKKLVTQYTGEIAEYKRKERERMSEEERKEAERAERDAQREAELKTYKDRERVSTYTAKLLASGFDEATATSMASVLPEGVSDDFFDKQRDFIASKEQEAKTKHINGQPDLSKGSPLTKATADDEETNMLRKYMGLK